MESKEKDEELEKKDKQIAELKKKTPALRELQFLTVCQLIVMKA